ncbi:MAG: flagellar biosynthesis anti-sigma factor FlgM [Bryobacteraceae bacterium]
MRVDDRYMNSSQAIQPGKASGAQEVDRQPEMRSGEPRWGLASDRVELSELTGGLARMLSLAAQQRAEHVERLRQDYAAGRYQVNIAELSRKIAAEMRTSASKPLVNEVGRKP